MTLEPLSLQEERVSIIESAAMTHKSFFILHLFAIFKERVLCQLAFAILKGCCAKACGVGLSPIQHLFHLILTFSRRIFNGYDTNLIFFYFLYFPYGVFMLK